MSQETLKTIELVADIASSISATFAIFLFVKNFLNNRGKPLNIIKTVAYRHIDNESRFYFVIKNRREHTVQINKVTCYTEDLYILRKYKDSPPSYYKTFSSIKKIFDLPVNLILAPSCEDNLIITISGTIDNVNTVCLNMWTDYGYYEHKLKNVVIYDSGEMEVTDIDSWEDCKSKNEARLKYYKEYAKYLWAKINHSMNNK